MSSAKTVAPPDSYHTQHSPFGAFASFTVGLVNAPGGFGQSLRGPAKQNVYVGFRVGPEEKWQLLPFLTPPKSNESAFTGDAVSSHAPSNFVAMTPADYERILDWASDTWNTDDGRFSYSLITPFSEEPAPARLKQYTPRFPLAPVI